MSPYTHTKGPWVAYKLEHGAGYGVQNANGDKTIVESLAIKREANARLIAAAPELYDLVQQILNPSASSLKLRQGAIDVLRKIAGG